MQQQKNIWDDSLCTVDESINSEAVSMVPNLTMEFRNSLITNKGDISTARKITSMETVDRLLDGDNNSKHQELSSSSNSVSSNS